MTAKPWFKFHVADFRAEMLLLSPAQRGAYISLLMYYWENEGLPDDDEKLAKIAGMRMRDWRRNRTTLGALFGPCWNHPRVNCMLAEWLENPTNARRPPCKCTANAEQVHMQTTCYARACQSLRKESNRRVRVGGTLKEAFENKLGLLFVIVKSVPGLGSLPPANRSMNLEYCDRASIRLSSDAAVHDAAVREIAVSSSPNILAADIRLR